MKIRNGFVSNSSSSSFCIWGCHMEFSEMTKKIAAKLSKEMENKLKENGVLEEDEILEDCLSEDFDFAIIYEAVKLIDTNKIASHLAFIRDEDWAYIGRYYTSIKDDETGGEFRDSTTKAIELLFGDQECESIEGTIYN